MTRCSVCPAKYRPLPADGPTPARILVVGERPGSTENKYQRVFIGKTGQEFDETYLPLAGLHRSDVRVTNVVRCWADGNRTPSDKEIAVCGAHHLPAEIERTQPELIILMGGSACQLVPSIRLDMHHGFPQWGRLFDYEGWILPMYHPALGLHESRWMTQLLEDWERLQTCEIDYGVTRSTGYFKTPERQLDYRLLHGYDETYACLMSEWEKDYRGPLLAVDTEDHCGVPYSIQFSYRPGMGRMLLAEDYAAVEAFAFLLNGDGSDVWTPEVALHNAPHDLDVLSRMLVEVPKYRDTMQEAFHLGNLPQGLKPLVYRLFGYTMTSWEDVVRPASIEALICWIVEALDIARADLSLIKVSRYKKPYRGALVKETVTKGPLEHLLSRLLQHTAADSEYDPWERLDEFWANDANEWMTNHTEARIGHYPRLGIANASLARAVTYGCGDADWTGQVATELAIRRQAPSWQIAQEDYDN